jgi:DNA-directed RNA polymerase specialized sigma24 family protein
MRGWIAETAASDDDSGIVNLDALPEARNHGSLKYALEMVDFILPLLAGRPEALSALKGTTGHNFISYFERAAQIHGHPYENAPEDVISVLFERISRIVEDALKKEHRPVYQDQRAALATIVRNAIYDHTGGKRLPDPAVGGKRKRSGRPDPIQVPRPVQLEEAQPLPAPGPDLTEEQQIWLLNAINHDQVTEKQRQWIMLRLQGLEGQGLADALGKSLSATEKLGARAMLTLKKIAGADGGDS